MYAYTFEVLMGFNGERGLREKPFTINDVMIAETEIEAIEKLDAENDELGYKVLNVKLIKIEDKEVFSRRVIKEFDEEFKRGSKKLI